MTKTSRPIVFFGNERLATGVKTSAPTLKRLIDAGYPVEAVIVNNDYSASRKKRQLEIAEVAQNCNIPLWLPKRLSEIRDKLIALNPEIGILVAYGKIVPQSIIDIFPGGIVNIHPSLLPRHRGPTPIESTILNGENETGVSIMQLTRGMDAGPVYVQVKMSVGDNESKQELADKLLEAGGNALLKTMPAILAKELTPQPQDGSKATYDSLIKKTDGIINWEKPAYQIEREIRAFYGWPGSRTTIANKEVIITKAYASSTDLQGHNPGDAVVDKESGNIAVSTKKGSLIIEQLKPANKKDMPAAAFIAGHRQLLG